jgi:hypothetical protein
MKIPQFINPVKKICSYILKVIKSILLLIVLLAIISALYNLSLPEESKTIEYLSEAQKACIYEWKNLQEKKGNEIWPGWGSTQIPVIVYNEKYAFLVGYPDPPKGWYRMPSEEHRGNHWEVLETDDFYGEPYYRQLLPDPDITPENFTVKVGNQWVATLQTKEYAAVSFYKGFKDELPPVINAIFPYKTFWKLIMGEAEDYIGGIAHESFHAFQGTKVPQRLAESENSGCFTSDYPWHEMENASGWIEETKLLLEAYNSENMDAARSLVTGFIEKRDHRRRQSRLSKELILYEQKREWLEGLAKYAELIICVSADEDQNYEPVNVIKAVSGFNHYEKRSVKFNRQIGEVRRAASRSGESRFYYGGMLQAVMLDRLMPGWQDAIFDENVYLDDLLRKAIDSG